MFAVFVDQLTIKIWWKMITQIGFVIFNIFINSIFFKLLIIINLNV